MSETTQETAGPKALILPIRHDRAGILVDANGNTVGFISLVDGSLADDDEVADYFVQCVAERPALIAERDGLLKLLKRFYLQYVILLENGHDRIKFLGGDCDIVETMELNTPILREVRELLEARRAALRTGGK